MAVSVTSCDAGGIPVTTTARGSSSCDTMSDRSSGALAGGGKREGAIAACTHHRVCKPADVRVTSGHQVKRGQVRHTTFRQLRRGGEHTIICTPCRACTATREHDTDVVCWPQPCVPQSRHEALQRHAPQQWHAPNFSASSLGGSPAVGEALPAVPATVGDPRGAATLNCWSSMESTSCTVLAAPSGRSTRYVAPTPL